MPNTEKQYTSKVFDTRTEAGLKAAERYKTLLNNQYESVEVLTLGLTRIQISGRRPIGVR